MCHDVIKTLKSNLADLTYILFTIGKEFDLMIQKSEDEKHKNKVRQIISALQESNSEVIKLYHEIKLHEEGLKNELYCNEEVITNLQYQVDNLRKSIEILLGGNDKILKLNE